ncbi:30505_t:CDS:2, partial [Gigaspora margarita]
MRSRNVPVESMTDEQFWSIIMTRTMKIIDDLFEARIRTREKICKSTTTTKMLEEKWSGPYKIHEVLGNGTYKLQTMDWREQV